MANTSARGPEGLPGASAAGQPCRIGSVTLPTNGPLSTITALDPTADKPDPVFYSVRKLIVEDRAESLAFTDPGSGRAVPIEGVSLGRLTVDSFVPVKNHHLRMGLSGTLASKQGQEAAPHTVYARSRKAGSWTASPSIPPPTWGTAALTAAASSCSRWTEPGVPSSGTRPPASPLSRAT
ncbi:hypothetical protein [Xanthobacter variabilis]|uniref:hypothetical protein n=1 Tax=Xanthobacter variabilis TaxID=3119932 RepID=UPI00372703FA